MLTKLKSLIIVLLSICCMLMAICQGDVGLKNGERPFSGEVAKVLGGNGIRWNECGYDTKAFTIAGRLFTGQIGNVNSDEKEIWASFDIRGWDRFVTQLGIMDDNAGQKAILTVEIDGNTIMKKDVRHGDKAVPIEIPLTGCNVLTFRWNGNPCFAEAKLIKGDPTPLFACQQCYQQFTSPKMLIGHINEHIVKLRFPCQNCDQIFTTPKLLSDHITAYHVKSSPLATYYVDPSDIDKLATSLRTLVDAQTEIKGRMATAKVGITTFTLIEIEPLSVAQNAAEDLSTSLVKNRFKTVERGQIDRTLIELKIQSSAYINPENAKEISRLTGCDMILVGSISDRGQFVIINCRLIDASGETIVSERVECSKKMIER